MPKAYFPDVSRNETLDSLDLDRLFHDDPGTWYILTRTPNATDLDYLSDWARDIQKLLTRFAWPPGSIGLSDQEPLRKENAWLFRPGPHVQDALTRLDARFPQAIEQISECRTDGRTILPTMGDPGFSHGAWLPRSLRKPVRGP